VVAAQVWEDLQTTATPATRINTSTHKGSVSLKMFLRALQFLEILEMCPKETQRKGQTGKCQNMAQKWGWCFLKCIQALKDEKENS